MPSKTTLTRWITAALAALLVLTSMPLLASASPLPKEEWPQVEFSFWEFGDVYSFMDENQDDLADQMEAAGQIDLVNRPITVSDYVDKTTLWAATDDLPDIWMFDGPGQKVIWDWAEQGLIRSIPTDLSEYPYVQEYLYGENVPVVFERVKRDGIYWAMPRANVQEPVTYTYGHSFMRKEDYEALGSPAIPTTIDEWFDFCTLIQQKWPEKIVLGGVHVDNFFTEIDPDMNDKVWVYMEEHGMYVPAFFGRYERYKQFNRFWKAGLIDLDFFNSLDGSTLNDRFAAGQVVLYPQDPFPGHLANDLNRIWLGKYPDIPASEALMMLMPPTDADGKHYKMPVGYWSENYISAKVTDEQFAAIMRLYNYLLSPEGLEMRRYGVADKDFTKDGDAYVLTREMHASGEMKALSECYPSGTFARSWATWDEEFPFVDPSIDPGLLAFGQQYLEATKDYFERPAIYTELLGLIQTERSTEFVINSGKEDLVNLVQADDYDATWNAMMQKYLGLGLLEMAQEVNDLGRAAGYID